MAPLVRSARAGHIELLWSPAIITEASRVLLWIWLQKRGGAMTDALKRESFDIARRWFTVMSSVFRVVEDCPPYAQQWTDTPRDEHDRPLWTAAINASAHIVVTENLQDGPPADSDGFRTWSGIIYVHPDTAVKILHVYGSTVDRRALVARDPDMESPMDQTESPIVMLSSSILEFLKTIELRALDVLPPAEQPE